MIRILGSPKRWNKVSKVATLTLMFCFVCFVAGCANDNVNTMGDKIHETNPKLTTSSTPEDAQFDIKDLDERVTNAQTQFALNIFHAVRDDAGSEGNLFISPYSIASALAMTANGATKDTLVQMQETLHAQGLSLEEMNKGYQVLTDLLTHSGEEVKLSIAGSLWARKGLSFHDEFLNANRTYYNAEITALDFGAPAAIDQMNHWVNKQTRGKIPKIIEGPIDDMTILYLLNAIYFEANWAKPFKEDGTEQKPFTLPDGSTKNVPMMVNSGTFQYLDGDGFEAIRLPYKGNRISMLVFLPEEGTDFIDFTSKLSADRWHNWIHSFERANGSLEMPRFEMEFETSLKDVLEQLGMTLAFDPTKAQFDNMITTSENVYLKDVKHKAYIEVEEEGTVAAAVTSVEAGITSAPAKTFQMTVDRPFFFAIHDHTTDTLLFMGAVIEP